MEVNLAQLRDVMKQETEATTLSVIKHLYPALDEVKLCELELNSGEKKWMKYHIKRGTLKTFRKGRAKNSPLYVSRFEIAILKKAEREAAKFL